MKLLFISMELPYPDHSGGSKYAWQKIRQLSKDNEIYLMFFNEKNEKIQYDEYYKYVKKIYEYKRKKNWLYILLNLFRPYSLTSRVNKEMQNDIYSVIKEEKIEIILLDSIHMYYNLNKISNENIDIFLTQQNIEYRLFENISEKTQNILKKIIYKLEALKLRKLEKRLYNKKYFKGYIFISNEDLQEYQRTFGKVNAICIPPAMENLISSNNENIEKNTIVFTGKMSYEPNVTGAKWFLDEVWSIIKKEVPETKFYIVGKDPLPELIDKAKPDVFVTGEVDDIYEYIDKAQIVIIPLLSGGGVKLKLFDALAMNKIVISTSKGVEGTSLENKKDLYVTDNYNEFAQLCINNLKNPNFQLANHGKKTIEKIYKFENLQNILQKFIEEKK